MLRRMALALSLAAFALGLTGCGGDSGPTNPNNLEYSKDGPPKRDGTPAMGGKGKTR